MKIYYSSLTINIKTDFSGIWNFCVDSSVSTSAISVKVNDNRPTRPIKVDEKFWNNNNNYIRYKISINPGDIEITINSREFFITYMFENENWFYSIAMKSSNTFVLNMEYIFNKCSNLISIDLTELDLSKVTTFLASFQNCINLKYVKFGNSSTPNLNKMGAMFYNCYKLESIDLTNFDTSKVESIYSVFYDCASLKEIKIDNFNISNARDMSYMFYNCRSLTSINISHFGNKKNKSMDNMFFGCSSLTYLDMSNFKVSQIINMEQMFYSCRKLKSLDLSGFDTSLVTSMQSMFEECESLMDLNINNFDTSKVTSMKFMFAGCSSLTSLNLSNFEFSENTKYEDMFYGIAENLIYCVKDDVYEKIKSEMYNKACALRVINCIPEWTNASKKIIEENGQCIEKCNLTENYKYEYEEKCYSSCPKGTTSLFNNNFICQTLEDIIFIINQKKEESFKIESSIANIDKSDSIINSFINSIITYEEKEINKSIEIIINKENTIINKEKTNIIMENDNVIYNNTFSYKICQPFDFLSNECNPIKHNSMIEMIKNDISNGLIMLEDVLNEKKSILIDIIVI